MSDFFDSGFFTVAPLNFPGKQTSNGQHTSLVPFTPHVPAVSLLDSHVLWLWKLWATKPNIKLFSLQIGQIYVEILHLFTAGKIFE